MGLDATVDESLVLRSGRLHRVGTVESEAYYGAGLLNPEHWYQKECYCLYSWAKKNLERREGECFVLTEEAVRKLISDCSAALDFYRSGETDKLRELFPDDDCEMSWRYGEGKNRYGYRFEGDVEKIKRSMGILLGLATFDDDHVYELSFDW